MTEEIDRMIDKRGKESHTGLWLRFAAALGRPRQQIIETEMLPGDAE